MFFLEVRKILKFPLVILNTIGFNILKRPCIPFTVAEISVHKDTVLQRNAEKRVIKWLFTNSDAKSFTIFSEASSEILMLKRYYV